MRKRLLIFCLSIVMILCGSTTAFASLSDNTDNNIQLPTHPYSNALINIGGYNSASSISGGGLSEDTSSVGSNYDPNKWKRYKVTLGSDKEKDVNITGVYPNYLYFGGSYWTVTVNITKVSGKASGDKVSVGLRTQQPGFSINFGSWDDENRANVQANVVITNSSTGAVMPYSAYNLLFGVTDVDKYEVYRFYDTNINNYYTDPTMTGSSVIHYGRNDTSLDFCGKDSDNTTAERQRFYWRVTSSGSIPLRYGTTTEKHYASSLNFHAQRVPYQVSYQWVGDHPNKAVPAGATVLNGDPYNVSTQYPVGTKVREENVTYNGVTYPRGTWTFNGWDRSGTIYIMGNTVIHGTWHFEPEWKVEYYSDHGAESLSPHEDQDPNDPAATRPCRYTNQNPQGATLVTKSSWKFIKWTTRKAVTLNDGTQIPADGDITMDQIKQVKVTQDLVFDAHHIPRPQIELKKTADKQYYEKGDIVTYRIKVWNARVTVEDIPTKETNLIVEDRIPDGLQVSEVTVEPSSAVEPGGIHIIDNYVKVGFGTFTSQTPTIIVKAKVMDDVFYSKDILNTATLVGEDSEFKHGEDQSDDSATITQVGPNLSIEKKTDKQNYHVGDTVHYTIVAKNSAPNSWADNLVIDDVGLSPGQELIADSVHSTMGSAQVSGNNIIVTVDQLKYNESVTVEFDARVTNNGLKSNIMTNEAQVSSKQTGDGPKADTSANILATVDYKWEGPHPDRDVPESETCDWGITYQTSKLYTKGFKTKDVVDGQKGIWVFDGWDHKDAFTLLEDTTIVGRWTFIPQYDITTSIENGTITETEKNILEGSNKVVAYTPYPDYQVKTVTVDGEEKDIKEYPASYSFMNITADHDVKVVCEHIPKLDIVKTADKDVYSAGDTVTYTVTISQTVKDAEARDVVIEDVMPEGVTLNQDSISGGVNIISTDEHSYSVGIDSLKDEPVTYTYTGVTAKYMDAEELINVVNATGSNVPTGAQDDASVTALVPKPELTKIVSNESPIYGEKITYFITVKEPQDNIVIRNATITDTIPDGLKYIDGSVRCDGNEAEVSASDGVITITAPELADEVTVSFDATVDAVSGSIDNIAVLSGDNIHELQDNATINIVEPEPTLTKTVVESSGSIGDIVSYTVTADTNIALKDAVITDVVPDGLTLVADSVKCSDEQAEVTVDGNKIEVKSSTIKQSVVITYNAVLAGEGVHTNTATLEAYNLPAGPLTAQAEVEVYKPEPVIEKTAEPSTVSNGGTVTYTIKAYTTKGTVHDAVITDKLPNGLSYVKNSFKIKGDEADYKIKDGAIIVDVPALSEGVTITFKAKVDSVSGKVDNIALLSGSNIEEIQDNAVVDIVDPSPSITKQVSKQESYIGDVVEYTVTANSDVTLTNAVIKDTMPDGMQLVEGSVKCSDSGVKIEVTKQGFVANVAFLQKPITITYSAVVEKEGLHENVVALTADNFPKGPISAKAAVKGFEIVPVITKTVDKDQGAVDDIVKYTITAKSDQGVIQNAVITDKLPKGIEVDKETIIVSGSHPFTLDDDSLVIKCGDLGKEPVVITYSAKLVDSGNQENVATITGDNVKPPVEARASVKAIAKEKVEKENPTEEKTTPAEEESVERAAYKTGDFLPYIIGVILLGLIVGITVVLRKRSRNDDNIDE